MKAAPLCSSRVNGKRTLEQSTHFENFWETGICKNPSKFTDTDSFQRMPVSLHWTPIIWMSDRFLLNTSDKWYSIKILQEWTQNKFNFTKNKTIPAPRAAISFGAIMVCRMPDPARSPQATADTSQSGNQCRQDSIFVRDCHGVTVGLLSPRSHQTCAVTQVYYSITADRKHLVREVDRASGPGPPILWPRR